MLYSLHRIVYSSCSSTHFLRDKIAEIFISVIWIFSDLRPPHPHPNWKHKSLTKSMADIQFLLPMRTCNIKCMGAGRIPISSVTWFIATMAWLWKMWFHYFSINCPCGMSNHVSQSFVGRWGHSMCEKIMSSVPVRQNGVVCNDLYHRDFKWFVCVCVLWTCSWDTSK